jgi:hypothetical protein
LAVWSGLLDFVLIPRQIDPDKNKAEAGFTITVYTRLYAFIANIA